MMNLEVTAVSAMFGTKASCTITVCPRTKEISVEPDTIYWYRGRKNPPVTVKATVEPKDIPPDRLTWEAYDAKKLTVTPPGADPDSIAGGEYRS